MICTLILEYDVREDLRFVKIQFGSRVFDIITKDRAAKFVDMLAEIGGTMGLLTGFSIITAVEIVYFASKIIFRFFKTIVSTKKDHTNNDSNLI